ncbi:hypothetical protein BGW38_001887 [Lunasporangiospora selenospora]|uniref:Ion transport domain-containing protein n=1 Tax=Lunasporangiospora selenospora TaxID=979761 RepID=A0A9P6KHB9_9FUNG|nr:hypothetical protein BGW38_001887 [Lunasporangiospora selenospora]
MKKSIWLDCILPAVPSPRKAFHICHGVGRNSRGLQIPATVLCVDISVSGSHAATLSQIGKRAFLDLWELRLPEATSKDTYPFSHTTSNAYSVIDIDAREWDTKLSVSWNGSQIVVHKTQHFFPGAVAVFDYPGSPPRQESPKQLIPLQLEPSNRHIQCTTLQSFGGDVGFTYLSAYRWGDDSERLVACDQKGFSVFKTAGQWEMLYYIPVSRRLNALTDTRVASAAAGGILTLEISPHSLMIWDIASKTPIQFIDTTHWIRKHFLSSTGETLAIVTEKALLLYSTKSGDLVQRLNMPSDEWHGFLEGDRKIYGSSFHQRKRSYFIADTSNISRSKEPIVSLLDLNHIAQDIKVEGERKGSNTESAVVACYQGSVFEVSYLDDTPTGTKNESRCTTDCASNICKVPEVLYGEEVDYPGGTFVVQMNNRNPSKNMKMDILFKDGGLRQYKWRATSCYLQAKVSQLVVIDEVKYIRYLRVWRLPQSSQEDLELLFYWDQYCINEVHRLSACSHGGNLTLNTMEGSIQLYSGISFIPEDAGVIFESLTRLALEREDQFDEISDSTIKYLCSFVNYYPVPDDHSESLMSKLCSIQDNANIVSVSLFLKRLLQSNTTNTTNSWVPLKAYSRGANPLMIVLSKAKTDPAAMEIARILIEYTLDKAKEANDISYILYLVECMDDLLARHTDLALRVTRGFSYIQYHDRTFIVNNHKIAFPPALHQFWTPNERKIYQCRNPVLQTDLAVEEHDPLNVNFTEEVFVAPVNLLWSFAPKVRTPCSEFPGPYPNQKTTWAQAVYCAMLFCMNPFGHVYIRPRFYSLEILYNPAIEAVVQYKCIHQVTNILRISEDAVTADFSFSVVFVFLHLLAELRVSETVCKYITIMFGILREIRVFFMVLAASMIFFTIAIVHVIHGGVDPSKRVANSSLPNNFPEAITTVYLMMGGRYDPLNNDLYVDGEGEAEASYTNKPLLLMVMVYFTFSSILMLNVLIALINSAFIKADDSWRQVWLENRLGYVEAAENMSYHIPGFRETFNWFPSIIYYTATSNQVKQYWRRVAKMDEEFIFKDGSTSQTSGLTAAKEDEQLAKQSLAKTSNRELEGELTKQSQVLVDGFSDIMKRFTQHEQYLNDLKRSTEKLPVQELQQDIAELDTRIAMANTEVSGVKDELSGVKDELSKMKATISETKVDVFEVREGIVKIQNDINDILQVLRGLQAQRDGP